MIALAQGKDPDQVQLSKESLAAAEDKIKFKILQKAEQRVKAVRYLAHSMVILVVRTFGASFNLRRTGS